MARIKVAFALNNLGLGGIEHHLCRQLRHFDRSRFEPYLILLSGERDAGVHPDVPADVPTLRFKFRNIWHVSEYVRLYRALKEIKPNIVVSSVFDANTVMRILKPFIGYAAIPREHSITVGKPRWQYAVDRMLAPFSYTIIGVSAAVADYAAARSGISRSRYTVIHNGVDLNEVAAAAGSDAYLRTDMGLHGSEQAVLCVGRLKEQKNQKLLVEAFALFAPAHPEYKLVFVGDGKDRGMLERLAAERGIAPRVVFMGARTDVLRLYPLAHVTAISSPFEGFGTVCVESMACGTPVVSTRSGGTEEIIDDGVNGFLVDSSPESVAAGLSRVCALGDPERADMERACRKTAERFSMRKNVAAYEALFELATGI